MDAGKGMKTKTLRSLMFSIVCGFYAIAATAAVSLFSDYGLIQNVQNYSTNPFWSPNAPYNQRLPQPVYVQGADLNADDCISVVQSLVSVQCMARDNCKNAELSDIRPAIMVQLSNLPGHNYVSACSGYIDGIFESYKQQYANTLPNRPTAFPNATVPNPDLDDDDGMLKFENPYKRQDPKWKQEENERAAELQALQRQNGMDSEHVQYTDFPATYADLSFSERIENDRTGLEPFKDLKAYKTLDVKTAEEWCGKDASNSKSTECMIYFCKEDGPKANQPMCISWRCEKADYYNEHQQECDSNEFCAQNPDSYDCMNYKCHNTDEQNSANCIKWLCDNNANYKLEHEEECSALDNGYVEQAAKEEQGIGQKNIKQEPTSGYYYARIRVGNNKKVSTNNRFNRCFKVCDTNLNNGKLDTLNEKAQDALNWWKVVPQGIASGSLLRCADKDKVGIIVAENDKSMLKMTEAQKNELVNLVREKVQDKGGCDWGTKTIYMQIGTIPENGSYNQFTVTQQIILDN